MCNHPSPLRSPFPLFLPKIYFHRDCCTSGFHGAQPIITSVTFFCRAGLAPGYQLPLLWRFQHRLCVPHVLSRAVSPVPALALSCLWQWFADHRLVCSISLCSQPRTSLLLPRLLLHPGFMPPAIFACPCHQDHTRLSGLPHVQVLPHAGGGLLPRTNGGLFLHAATGCGIYDGECVAAYAPCCLSSLTVVHLAACVRGRLRQRQLQLSLSLARPGTQKLVCSPCARCRATRTVYRAGLILLRPTIFYGLSSHLHGCLCVVAP